MTPRPLLLAVVLALPLPAAAQAPAPPTPPKVEIKVPAVEVGGAPSIPSDTVFEGIGGAPSIPSDTVFEVGEAQLRPAALPLLDAVARALAADGSPRFAINVHTDDAAPDGDRSGAWLQKLTQRRADAIKAYLARRGVPAKKLAAIGHGSATPVGDNRTEAGRASNRRIEVLVESEVRPPVAADLPIYTRGMKGAGKLIATIATTKGILHCDLFEQQAPMTVANFVGLATGQKPWLDPRTKKVMKGKPFYDGLVFHRVIPQFMIQGGDPLGVGSGGPGYKFADETSPALTHQPGSLSMANAGPGTNGSQFFVTEVATSWLNGRHTVFGHCKEVDVVTTIANVPRTGDTPAEQVVITKLSISRAPL